MRNTLRTLIKLYTSLYGVKDALGKKAFTYSPEVMREFERKVVKLLGESNKETGERIPSERSEPTPVANKFEIKIITKLTKLYVALYDILDKNAFADSPEVMREFERKVVKLLGESNKETGERIPSERSEPAPVSKEIKRLTTEEEVREYLRGNPLPTDLAAKRRDINHADLGHMYHILFKTQPRKRTSREELIRLITGYFINMERAGRLV